MDFLNRKCIAAIEALRAEIELLRNGIDSIRNQQERYREQAQAERELPKPPIRVEAAIYEIKDPSGKEKSASERQLTVQWVIAAGTWGAFITAGIYAGLTYCMLHSVQEQTRIQREAGINAQRAWVGLGTAITIDGIQNTPKGIAIAGHYSIKNFGHGPATKVVQSGLFVSEPEIHNLEMTKRTAKSFCDSSIAFATGTVPHTANIENPGPFGYTLFPDQLHFEPIQYLGATPETIRYLRFIGCVAYIDQFKQVHWTQFCMERKPGDTSPIPTLEFCAMFNETDEPKP